MRNILGTALILLLGVLMGCETVNPLCSDNVCIEGRVYPKSELAAGTAFDPLSIDDAQLMALLTGTDAPITTMPETTPATTPYFTSFIQHVEMANIVSNGLLGAQAYEGKMISVEATIDANLSDLKNPTVALKAGDDLFFIAASMSEKSREQIITLQTGNSYRLTLYVFSANPPDTGHTRWTVFTFLLHSENAQSKASSYTPIETTPLEFSTLVKSGSQMFFGEIVSLTAAVGTNYALKGDNEPLVSLVFPNNLIFGIFDVSSEGVDNLKRFSEGETYQWTVFIAEIIKPKPGEVVWTVRSSKVNNAN